MNTSGVWGEDIACEHIKNAGFEIIARNYTSRYGEIDIIAQGFGFIIFAEVKQRKSGSMISGIDAVSRLKMQKIYQTALTYLSENPCELQPRFDVISIVGSKSNPESVCIQWIENAFDCDYFA